MILSWSQMKEFVEKRSCLSQLLEHQDKTSFGRGIQWKCNIYRFEKAYEKIEHKQLMKNENTIQGKRKNIEVVIEEVLNKGTKS